MTALGLTTCTTTGDEMHETFEPYSAAQHITGIEALERENLNSGWVLQRIARGMQTDLILETWSPQAPTRTGVSYRRSVPVTIDRTLAPTQIRMYYRRR